MFRDKTIGIVVPCYNVSELIDKVINTLPEFADYIICIDDCSTDDTLERIKNHSRKDGRLVVLSNDVNQGVGGAIGRGYIWARDNNIDIAVVMAGDAQMDPADLPAIIEPVVTGRVDYVKGNRFFNPFVVKKMPAVRLFGGIVLSFLTKIASGYWHVADSQCGYTAVSLKVLKTIDPMSIYKRYGMPNDFLVTLNIFNFSVMDVPINPIYGIGEKSGIKIPKVVFSISALLTRLFFRRMWAKYIYQSFHPLVLLYFYGIPAFFIGLIAGASVLIVDTFYKDIMVGYGWMILFSLMIISGYFSIVIAMFMDMEYNKNLYKI